MLTYKISEQLEVVGYSDSDYGGCLNSLKSTSGFVFMLANGAILWKSEKTIKYCFIHDGSRVCCLF